MTTPTLEQFLPAAREDNPDVPERDLIAYYEQTYGKPEPTSALPSREKFMAAARSDNPEVPEHELHNYWEEHYGAKGAREKDPGFGESFVAGVKGGYHALKSSTAGTFERLQNPEDQWHKVGEDAANAFDQDAAKYAPSPELKDQPWYQRLSNPEYLGNLLGNVAVQSAPSLAGAAAGGVLAGPAGAAAGMLAVTYFQQAGQTYREAFDRYKKDGLDEQQAHEKAYTDSGIAGLVSGVVNSLAIPASLVAPFTSTLKNLALQYVLNVAVDTGDQATQNVVAKATYKPEQDLTEGLAEAGVGSALMSAPETMTTVKSMTGGPAKVTVPHAPAEPLPDTTIHPATIPAAIGVGEPSVSIEDAIKIASQIVSTPQERLSALAQRMADNAAVVSGERLPTQEEAARLSTRTPRQSTSIPILPGAEPSGPFAPITDLSHMWQHEALEPTPNLITPGVAFTPRGAPAHNPRAVIEAERQRLLNMPRRTSLGEGASSPAVPPVGSPEAPSKALPRASEKAYPSIEDLHALADSKGLAWDNSPVFMEMTKMVTGKSHLDDLTPQQRQKMADQISKIHGSTPVEPPTAFPVKTIESPPTLPLAQQTERLSTFDAAQVPRGTLIPEQNAEMLARAEKAQADLEIAGNERGTRVFTETQGQGSTQEVTGLKSATADWYKDATTGPMKLSRQRVDKAVAKIIEDKGRDVGTDVQRIKELLLQDQEFNRSEFAPKTDADWQTLIEAATGHAAVEQAAHEAATSPQNELPEPSQAQKEAGNYQKGHVRVSGLDISIENPAGSERSGTDPNGKPWSITMKDHYGYIRGTRGKDKDHIDVFIKPGTPTDYSGPVFVVDQNKPGTKSFDEHKVILGASNSTEARLLYRQNYAKDWKGLAALSTFTMPQFKAWLQSDTTKPAVAYHAPSGSVQSPPIFQKPDGSFDAEAFDKREANIKEEVKASKASGVKHLDQIPFAVETMRGLRIRSIRNGSTGVVTAATSFNQVYVQWDNKASSDANLGTAEESKYGTEYHSALNKGDLSEFVVQPGGKALVSQGHVVIPKSQRRLKTETIPPVAETKPPIPETKAQEGEPFALKHETVKPPKAKAPEQQTIPVPPETIGTRPIIGREAQPEEAPLFSKAAQTPEAEQTTLPAEKAYGYKDLPQDVRKGMEQWGGEKSLNPKVASLVYGLNQAGLETTGSGDGYENSYVYVDLRDEPGAVDLPTGWIMTQKSMPVMKQDLGIEKMSKGHADQQAYLKREGHREPLVRLARTGGTVSPGEASAVVEALTAAEHAELKEPWQQTQAEYVKEKQAALAEQGKNNPSLLSASKGERFAQQARIAHHSQVEKALAEGKDAPANVLADYPDLPAKAAPHTPTTILANALRTAADQIEGKPKAKETANTNLQDVGQKIGGARKDKWAQRGLTIADLEGMSGGEEAKYITKQNIWRPDYAAMVTAGTDPKAAAMVKLVYDQLAAKPAKDTPEGRRDYLTMMGHIKDVYSQVKTVEDAEQGRKRLLYDKLGWDTKSRDDATRNVMFSVFKGRSEPFHIGYSERARAAKMVDQGFPNQEPWTRRYDVRQYELGTGITEHAATVYAKRVFESPDPWKTTFASEQALADRFKQSGVWRVSERGTGKIVGYRTTEEEGKSLAQDLYENKKGGADEGIEPVRPHLDNLKREGEDYRNGNDVTAEDFRTAFGFRGVEFGNWAASDERQKHINQAYDALRDMADVLGIDPKAISLNGTLGIAFGARGIGKFAAHYEPSKMVINITKINGPGAMAHEWGHALDHYFGELDRPDAYKGAAKGASGWYKMSRYAGQSSRLANLRPEMAQAFDRVMSTLFERNVTKAEAVRDAELNLEKIKQGVAEFGAKGDQYKDYVASLKVRQEAAGRVLTKLTGEDRPEGGYGKVDTSFYKAAQKLSGASGDYWKRPTEMFARSFESYVFDRLAKPSDYLVHGVEPDKFTKEKGYKENPYPAGVDREKINAAYNHLFDTMQSKETGQGTALHEEAVPYTTVPLSKGIQLLKDEHFDMQGIKNRRFMYNPQTRELVLGKENSGSHSSHAEELGKSGARGKFDQFVRGWIGTSKEYPDGVIHFAPPLLKRDYAKYPEVAEGAVHTIELFARNGATPNTVLRNVGEMGERPFGQSEFSSLQDLTPSQQLLQDHPYAVREGEQQDLNYEIAREALGDLDRAGTHVSATTGAIDTAQSPDVRTVAVGISPDLIHQGVVDLKGYRVTNAEDLAKLAQVYRDPRFETFRFIYVNGDRIVGHEGMTSRLPAVVQMFNSLKEEQAFIRDAPARMTAMGADGYWMLHNHPSGKSNPSLQDRQVTAKFEASLPGFRGHVVIDSNEYSLISIGKDGGVKTERHLKEFAPERLLVPSQPHPLLGSVITSVDDVLGIAKHLQSPDYVTVLYRAATGNTQAIQEMTKEFFQDTARSGPYLAEQGVAFGSQHIFTHMNATTANFSEPLYQNIQRLIEDGILADHVTEVGNTGHAFSLRDLGVEPNTTMVLGKRVAQSAERVESPALTPTETPAFKKWFGESKVVDENREPLAVYHGSDKDFSFFKPKTVNPWSAGGFWFTERPSHAYAYTGDVGANIKPVYLSIKNPAPWSEYMSASKSADARRDSGPELTQAIQRTLESKGYDGVSTQQGDDNVWIAFHPEQIKSATGNRGTFDPNNPSIVESPTAPYRSEHLGELNPAQETAIEHIHGNPATWRDTLNEFTDTWKMTLQQGLFDQFAPVLALSKKAYILLRMAKAGDGTLEALLLYGKPYVDSDGAYRVDYQEGSGMKGFSNVLAGLHGEQDRFMEWVAAQRADRLKGIGLEHLYSDQDIATLKTLNQGTMKDGTVREPAYLKALHELNDWNDAMLKIPMDSGLISAQTRDMYKDQPYVPFYRIDAEGDSPGFVVQAGAVNQYAWKKLKGGTEHLNDDLLANLLQNWSHLITASAKNRAAKETLEAAVAAGVAQEVPSGSPEKGLVHYMDQGKPVTFRVTDPALLDAIGALHYAGLGAVAKPFQMMKRYFSFAVTVNPAYKIRNLIRDSIQAIGTAELSYNPLKNIKEGIQATRHESETRAQLLAGGGMMRFGTMLDGNNADRTRRLIEQGVDPESILSGQGALTKFWKQKIQPAFEAYQEFGDRGEQVNRAALYTQLMKKGMSHQEAAFWARDLMDFSMSGKWAAVRILTQVVPFTGARLQGLYKIGRATAADYKRMGGTLAAVSLASIALMLAYKDDEDWKKRAPFDRENYWWWKIGGMAFRMPKPFEMGAFGTIAERSVEYLIEKEMTGKLFGERLAAVAANQLSMNPTPQLIKPLMDLYANKDAFTGQAIERPGMERLRKQDRVTEKTSEIARALGQLGLPDPTQLAMGRWETLSPVQVDSLVRGYFSWLGTMGTTVLDYGIRPMVDRGSRPNLKLKDVFLAGNFIETLPSGSSKYLTQFYDQALTVEQAYGSYKDAMKRGDYEEAKAIRSEEREKLALYPMIERVKREESLINTKLKMVEQSRSLSGEQKRIQIDQLREQKNRLAKMVSDRQLALR